MNPRRVVDVSTRVLAGTVRCIQCGHGPGGATIAGNYLGLGPKRYFPSEHENAGPALYLGNAHMTCDPKMMSRITTRYYKAGHVVFYDEKVLPKLHEDLGTFYRQALVKANPPQR